MSTLVQANGKTKEEMDVENLVKPNQSAPISMQGPQVSSVAIEEEKKLIEESVRGDDSDPPLTDDSEVRQKFNIITQQRQNSIQSSVPDQAPNTRYKANNNDGEGSSDSDESYYAELARIKAQKQASEQVSQIGLNAPSKKFVPKLAVKNLGLSTLQGEGQVKTAEELHVDQLLQESRVPVRGVMTNKMDAPALKKTATQPD